MPFFEPKKPTPPPSPHSILDKPLIEWGEAKKGYAAWTVRDAVEGVLSLGGTGTGKTSTSGRFLAGTLLDAGFGGVVLTVKDDECAMWQKWAASHGRADDVVVVRPDLNVGWNFLGDMIADPHITADAIVDVFMVLAELDKSSSSTGGDDAFWKSLMIGLMTHAIYTLELSDEENTIENLDKIVSTAPLNQADIESPEWKSTSFMAKTMGQIAGKQLNVVDDNKFSIIDQYWNIDFPTMPDKQRGTPISMFKNITRALLAPEVKSLFTHTNIDPHHCNEGAIYILDLPIHRTGKTGQIIQCMFKYLFLKQLGARPNADHINPVFVWVDEASEFVTTHDAQIFNQSRSAKVIHVYLAQSKSQFDGKLGHDNARMFLAAKPTLIFHKLNIPEDQEWAASVIGKKDQTSTSTNTKEDEEDEKGYTHSQSHEYIMQPSDFASLATGQDGVFEIVFKAPSARFKDTTKRSLKKQVPVAHCRMAFTRE